MATKWLYGDAWERFPIQPGEIWGLPNGSRLAVHNIFDPLPAFMLQADLIFVDPPWNLGNLNTFYTKAGRTDYQDSFQTFADILFLRLAQIVPRIAYVEVGCQAVNDFAARLERLYPIVQRWPVTYYRRHPCWMLRGAAVPTGHDLTGIDEASCIAQLAQYEDYDCLGDPCMGRGLAGLAAYRAGRPFVATELNQRRLACLLAALSDLGAPIHRLSS